MFGTGLPPKDASATGLAGLRPIGPVTGVCVYGAEYLHGDGPVTGAPGEVYRYHTAINPVRLSRSRALSRLAADAYALGADAVVSVRVAHAERPGRDEGGAVEATATGMAVAWEGRVHEPHEPHLTTMTVQEYWKLAHAGYLPVGVVTDTIMVGCAARDRIARSPLRARLTAVGRGSRELTDPSAMVRAAYQYAEVTVRQQVYAMNAEGVIDVRFDTRKWLAESKRLTFKMTLTVTATAITPAHLPQDGSTRRSQPVSPLRLRTVRTTNDQRS